MRSISVEHDHWLEMAYTRKLLIDLEKWSDTALRELRIASQKSSDPVVRALSGTYEAHMKAIGEIRAKKAEGRENGD